MSENAGIITCKHPVYSIETKKLEKVIYSDAWEWSPTHKIYHHENGKLSIPMENIAGFCMPDGIESDDYPDICKG